MAGSASEPIYVRSPSPNGLGKGLRWRDGGASRQLCSSSLVKGILKSRRRGDGMSLGDRKSNSWK